MDAPVTVIVNASSGTPRGGEFSADLAARFRSAGVNASIAMAGPGELVSQVRHALIEKPRMIVVGGGDGTLNSAASMLIGTDTAMGILPLGTLNHFARDLGIPPDVDAAIRTIAGGHVRKVDVGAVNDRYFLNNSSLGLYPRVVAGRIALQQRLGHGKANALVRAAFAVFRRYPFLDVRIDIDGTGISRRTPFVFIGNNRYEMEGFGIGSRARLDEAVLSLYVANHTGRFGLLRLMVRALFRRLDQAKDFDIASARSIVVDTRHAGLRVANDGELFHMQPPLDYRILPGALSVVVPRPAAALAADSAANPAADSAADAAASG